ncbi:MAG TPA: molybdopterin oxidoreductase family protein [Stellaceae bacterium]|nr:molybdopterin oxidoreductase family protein [Stellaceae bacterium]
MRPRRTPDPPLPASRPIGDEVKETTCYMCACRCGIKVHLKDGGIRYIEGNRDHPVNRGVLCAKGAAGIMQHYSPARLTRPLRRVGPRGSGEFREIDWDEALETATEWLGAIRRDDPRKLAFFTGRDQSQSLTSWWASQFGTPNYAAHGGFCSVNMAAAGFYTIGGSFWEFGAPDWEMTRYFLLFGVAEDHDSNPIKIGLGKLRARGAKIVSVNPVRTGYSAIADEWLAIRPGTDGLFVLALVHELLRAGRVDAASLAHFTNAPWLVIDDPGAADHGLFARDARGRPLVRDRVTGRVVPAADPEAQPDLREHATLADGRRAIPSFRLVAERYLDPKYAPASVAAETGLDAATIKRIAAELAHAAFEHDIAVEQPWTDAYGRRHERMVGRPVSMHAMRGISAHSNGFHTCRAIHLLQLLLGSIDAPGGFRFRPPYPKPIPPPPRPAGQMGELARGLPLPRSPLDGAPLGFPTGPEDLLVEEDGTPVRIDKAFSWEAPLAAHGLFHMVIHNAFAGDPYPIDTLFLYMANASWNSAMDSAGTMAKLAARDPETGRLRIPHVIYSDAYYSEMVAYADLVLPDTTYLERWDCISLLDRPISDPDAAADSIRQPVVEPHRDVRPFQDVLIELGARLELPGLVHAGGAPRYPGLYRDYIVNHERKAGIGSLAGWRGSGGDRHGTGAPNARQLDAYIAHGCVWRHEVPPQARYMKHVNRDYLEWATGMGFIDAPDPIVPQLYSETMQRFRLAAEGKGETVPPPSQRARIARYFDPLPIWYRPFEEDQIAEAEYPLHAITQRPMAMYHSWGSQNAWLRQIHGENRIHLHRDLAVSLGIEDDDWIELVSHHGRITAQAKLMDGVNRDTVWTWNAIAKRPGAWNLAPGAPESERGVLLNHLISTLLPAREDGLRYANTDPVTGQAAWYDLRVRIAKVAPSAVTEPRFPPQAVPASLPERPAVLRFGLARTRR